MGTTVVAPSLRRINWPHDVDELIGHATDRALGLALGLDEKTIAARRRHLGRDPYRQPPTVYEIVCIICDATTRTTTPPPGGRRSRMRQTCPPLPPEVVGECQKKLIIKTLLARPENQPSLAKQLRNIRGWKLTDGLGD